MNLARVASMVLVLALSACETTNSSDWTGGPGTPFKQAERTCQEELKNISKEENRRETADYDGSDLEPKPVKIMRHRCAP